MDDQVSRKAPARRRKRILLGIAFGLAIVVLLTIGVIVAYLAQAESALADKLAELESAGVPLTVEEVNRRYHQHGRDPAGNAAPHYQRAFAELLSEEVSERNFEEILKIRKHYRPLSLKDLDVIREVVTFNREATQLYKEAAAYPYVRFNLDFTEDYSLSLPHLAPIRDGARLLGADAILAAHENDADTAFTGLLHIYKMANHLAEEPTFMSQMTRMAIVSIGNVALERVLERTELKPAHLASLRVTLQSLETNSGLEAAYHTDLANAGIAYRDIESISDIVGEEPGPGEKEWFSWYRRSGMLARDHLTYLERLEDVLGVVQLPYRKRVQVEWPEELSGSPFRAQIIAFLLVAMLDRIVEADNRSLTWGRTAQIGLAAEQYRLKNGNFPSSPEDLVPEYLEEVPGDPYSEDGFRFVSEADAFFVRSVGVIDLPGDEGQMQIEFRLPKGR